MPRVLLIGFLIAHGLVHVAIWAPKCDPNKASFDPSDSWLIGDQRRSRRFWVRGGGDPRLGRHRSVGSRQLVASDCGRRAERVDHLAAPLLQPWHVFILIVNIALIVGVVWIDWPAKSTVGV